MRYLATSVVFVIGELIALGVFLLLKKRMTDNGAFDLSSISRGILERMVLMVGLLSEYPQIILPSEL